MAEFQYQRRHERVPTRGQVDGAVMVYEAMTIIDISYGGVQVETRFPLQLDSLHQFRLSLGDLSVVVRGRVAHCRVGELRGAAVMYRSGVEIVEPSEHVKNAISAFIDTLRNSRRAAMPDDDSGA